MNKTKYFLEVFKLAEKRYGKHEKRLAGDGWNHGWQTLIATIMSAQTRDEVTIPVAENLFKKYNSVEKLSKAKVGKVLKIIKSVNFSKTKAKNVVNTAKMLVKNCNGRVPDSIDELIKLPGVGRKTANLVLSEVHEKDVICIDTHCQRLLNVLGIVNTKTPHQTEIEMMKIVPKRYWSRINRIFVLWGKDVRGRDKKVLLRQINMR